MSAAVLITGILICIICGLAISFPCLYLLNHMPAEWLCDYGEEPDEALLHETRFYKKPHGIVLATASVVCFILSFLQYGTTVTFFCSCIATILLILAALSDAKYAILPDQFTLFLLIPALASAIYDIFCGGNVFFRKDVILPFFGTVNGIIMPIFGAVCGGLVMLLLNLIGKLIYKKEAVGFGDVKLFAVLGLFVGPVQIICVFFITVLTAGLHFIYLILRKKLDGNHYLPFGPYICAAFLLFLVFYSQINTGVTWYFSLFVK